MGLDMYLNAKRFIWYNEDDLAETVMKAFPELKGRRVKEVAIEAMYWRKSNQIHKWFVDNVQDGVDECQPHYVSREQLAQLRDLILEALEERDSSLLPTQAGFFFGTTDVDEWYWKDLSDTAEGIDKLLTEFDDKWEFEYRSSW
jgi:hypothetical protein